MPRCGQMAHQLLDVADRDRIDAGERLVEQHEGRARGERAGDLDAAPLAARERASTAILRSRVMLNSSSSAVELLLALRLFGSTSSSTARMFSSTVRPRKIEASCGR